MSGFVFPLQTALDLKRHAEEQARLRLAAAHKQVAERRDDLERSRERHQAILRAMRGSSTGARVVLSEIEHAHRVVADLRLRMERQRGRLAAAEQQCERCREELIEAARARRALERLAARGASEHRRLLQQQEQRELNEAAIMRYLMADEAPKLVTPTAAAHKDAA